MRVSFKLPPIPDLDLTVWHYIEVELDERRGEIEIMIDGKSVPNKHLNCKDEK